MSRDIELVNFEEDLDYELDVEMNIQDEDALLEDDKCDNESELIRKMSETSVSVIEPTDTPATTSEPTFLHTSSTQDSNDFWKKSISTFANVMMSTPINTNNEVVGSQDTLNKNVATNEIQVPVMEAIPPMLQHQSVHDDEQKDATETVAIRNVSVEPKDVDTTLFDPMEMSEKLTVTSSSSSTSTSSSSKNIKSKRNRNKKRKFLQRNALLNGFAHFKYRNKAIPSLMSVNTQLPFPRTKFPLLIPVNVPAQTPQKKVPFIIQANGEASRKVSLNPDFNGFATRNIANVMQRCSFKGKVEQSVNPNNRRPAATTVSNVDLNSVVINKRRSTTSLESISKPIDATPLQLPKSIVTAGMSDEEYLMAIAEQKKKRDEVFRQKEWKRGADEGWTFLE